MIKLFELKDFIVLVSECVEDVFRKRGQITAAYYAIDSAGQLHTIGPTTGMDREQTIAAAKAYFAEFKIDRYVFLDEAWALTTTDAHEAERALRDGITEHPDRREIVMFLAENRCGEVQTAHRFILRPEHGKPRLSPLKMQDMGIVGSLKGRMTGLLK